MIPPCLTLSNIRYVSRVKWNNPGKVVVPFPIPQCSSFWSPLSMVALDYGCSQLQSSSTTVTNFTLFYFLKETMITPLDRACFQLENIHVITSVGYTFSPAMNKNLHTASLKVVLKVMSSILLYYPTMLCGMAVEFEHSFLYLIIFLYCYWEQLSRMLHSPLKSFSYDGPAPHLTFSSCHLLPSVILSCCSLGSYCCLLLGSPLVLSSLLG